MQLSTGEVGMVVTPNAGAPLRPVVKIMRDRSGGKLKEPLTVDLSVRDAHTGTYVRSIVCSREGAEEDIDKLAYLEEGALE